MTIQSLTERQNEKDIYLTIIRTHRDKDDFFSPTSVITGLATGERPGGIGLEFVTE